MANVNAGFLLTDLFGDPSPQPVDLDTPTIDDSGSFGGHTLDTWVSIEGVYGANAHSNTITRDAQDNLLLGGDQADVLCGGGGSDILTAPTALRGYAMQAS